MGNDKAGRQHSKSVGFIGVGRMGGALLLRVVESGLIEPSMVSIFDKDEQKRDKMKALGVSWRAPADIVAACDVIVIAVKPKDMQQVLARLQRYLSPEHLVVSVAAGVSISFFQRAIGSGIPLARVMPNAGVLVGEGASAFAVSESVTEQQADFLQRLLETTGIVIRVEEEALDAVTGLSGSGPAYVYRFIEALTAGGVAEGLPANTAQELALQTVRGAAEIIAQADESIDQLVRAVATPGGTTAQGLEVLSRRDFAEIVTAAVAAAAHRSRNIKHELESDAPH